MRPPSILVTQKNDWPLSHMSAYFPTLTLLVQAFALAKSLLNLLFSGSILLLMAPSLGLLPEEQNDCGWIK